MTDRVGKVLEKVAHEAAMRSIDRYTEDGVLEVLEERLGPLLRDTHNALRDSLRYLDHAPECQFERTDNPHGDFCSCNYSKVRKAAVDAVAALATLEGRE